MPHAACVILDRDHARPRTPPAPPTPVIEQRLSDLLRPAVEQLEDEYHRLGLRGRVLTLPVMTCLLLALVWRQVPSVSDLVRLVAREPLYWTPPLRLTQQALSARLRTLPAELFGAVFATLQPQLQARAAQRTRPLPPLLARTQVHFRHIWAADCTTLEVLFRRVGLLRGAAARPLGGTLLAVLDVVSKLPVQLLLDPDSPINDRRYSSQLIGWLPPSTLLLVDAGFSAFALFEGVVAAGAHCLTPLRAKAAFDVAAVLQDTPTVRDRLIRTGLYRSNPCRVPLRLIEVRPTPESAWSGWVTTVLDPTVLPAADVPALYAQRWRIEEAFLLTKRLLNLSYLPAGAFNALALQVWTTWLLYAVLIDLSDAIADALGVPLARISVEMVYRGLYHFRQAVNRGEAEDPVAYLAAPQQRDLGIVKRRRKYREHLDTSPPTLNL